MGVCTGILLVKFVASPGIHLALCARVCQDEDGVMRITSWRWTRKLGSHALWLEYLGDVEGAAHCGQLFGGNRRLESLATCHCRSRQASYTVGRLKEFEEPSAV